MSYKCSSVFQDFLVNENGIMKVKVTLLHNTFESILTPNATSMYGINQM